MQKTLNSVGRNVRKFRCARRWTREELAAKLNLIGCHITSQDIANVEAHHCVVTNAQIVFFSEIFCVPIKDLSDQTTPE